MSSDCAMWAADGNGDGKYDLLAASNKLASPNDLLPVFRTSPSMISDEGKGKRACRRAITPRRR